MMSTSSNNDLATFIHHLPKLELHIHIEGTLTPSRRWTLAQKNHIPLPNYPTYAALEASYKTTYNHRKKLRGDNGAPTFLEAYYGGMDVLCTESDFYDLATDYFRKARDMGVRYCEPFFDPQAHTRRGVPLEAVMRGFRRAKMDAEERLGVSSNWVMCFLRDMSAESAMECYLAALPYRGEEGFVGIGLDSDEFDRPPVLFAEVFERARGDGLRVTCHCDVYQKDTHEHIRQVLCEIGADRIDHGLNAADRPKLIDMIRERGGGFGMTLCPHAYHRHEPTEMVFPKIRKLFDAGVKVTINSDDPTYMHENWVEENLLLAARLCPFSKTELVQLQGNAVDVCWASESVKEELRKSLEEYQRVSGI